MHVSVRYHALLREKTGRSEEGFALPEGGRVRDLLSRFAEKYPDLKALAERCHVARNDEFAGASEALQEGDRVDLLPPFGGG